VSIYKVNKFPGASPRTPFKRKDREGKGREGREHPQIKFYDYSTARKSIFEL
jgi:hypothetical protein